MKKLIIGAILCVTTVGVFGQGGIVMNSAVANAYVKFSNTVSSTWCVGDAFRAGLYWAADAATLQAGGGTLIAAGGTNNTGLAIFTGGTGGYLATTTFGGTRTLASRAGTSTFFQLRAWQNGFATWDEAKAGPVGTLYSIGAPVATATPAPDAVTAAPQIQWAPGSSSANPIVVSLIPVVPEPSVIALGVLGLAGALCIRRRK